MAEAVFTIKRFDELKQFPELFESRFSDAMTVGVNIVLSTAMEFSPVDRGFFRSSLYSDVIKKSPLMIIGRVSASAPHAPIIEGVDEEGNETEYGRRPGTAFPNIGELQLWVERVIGIEKVTARFVEQFPNEPIPEADILLRDATINIGRSIVYRGIKPKRPIGRAMAARRDEIQRIFNETAEKMAKDLEGRG